jgi:hypothetical protein
MRVRQRPQQNGVDDAEDGDVGPDPEGQRERGGEREPWRLPQHAKGEPHVLPGRLEHRFPAGRADGVPGDREISVLDIHRTLGLLGGHALAHLVVRRHLQEPAQFFLQLALDLIPAYERSQAGRKAVQEHRRATPRECARPPRPDVPTLASRCSAAAVRVRSRSNTSPACCFRCLAIGRE